MAIKAVIFDMGGVILRTEDPLPRQQLAQEYHFQLNQFNESLFFSEESQLAEMGQVSEAQHWQNVLAGYHVPEGERQSFIGRFWSGDRANKALIDLFGRLKGQYKVGLLSNAWDGARSTIQSQYNFLDVFDVSIFSAEVGLRKPDPRIYHLILDRLDVQPDEAVFIDDFPVNIEVARAVGLQAIRFTDTDLAIAELDRILGAPAGGTSH